MPERTDFITGLRALANFLERSPEVILPEASFKIFDFGEEDNLELVQKYVDMFAPCSQDKSNFGTLSIVKEFSGGIELRAIFLPPTAYPKRKM